MPINPLYYNESPGPQLVRDIMYKAPYEYLEKGEIAKAQTQAITKHTVNLLDSMLNTPALASKEPELQASNALYREKIDALTQNVSGGTVTLETKNQIRNLARQLSDDIKYGDRSVWATQYGARNAFIQNNIGLAKSDPALYQAALTQMENKLVSTNDKDELIDLSTVTLSASPTFGLENPDNLLRFEKLLQTESQNFYSTDKTVTEASKKEFLRTIVASNPKKVKEFIGNYMKSLPGYEAYLNSLHFANTGEINETPNKYQIDDIWNNPNHPYYKEAKALENALTSYSSGLSLNPAYIANIEAEKKQQEIFYEQAKNVGQPIAVKAQNNQVSQWQKLGEAQTTPSGIRIQSVAVRSSANKYLYNPKEQSRDWKQDAAAGINGNNYNFSPKDKKKDPFITEPNYVSQNKPYINKFREKLIRVVSHLSDYDSNGKLIKEPINLKKVTELVAVSASNVLKRLPLTWEKTSGKGVTDLTDDTYTNLTNEIYKEIKPQIEGMWLEATSLKQAINSSIRVGLYDAVQAMANTRNILDNATYNYESYPVLQKAQGNALNSQSNLLVQQIVSQSSNFLVYHNIEGEENIKQNNGKDLKISELSDLLHNNNILSVTHRNSPGPLGALSYAITYKSKTAKKDTQPETATVILKNIDSPESQAIYKDLSKIDMDAQSILRERKTSTGQLIYEHRPEVVDVNYARYVSLLYSGAPLITQKYVPGQSYSFKSISVNPEARIWKSLGIPEGIADDLYKAGGVVFNVEDDKIILPPSLFPNNNEVDAEEFYYNIPYLKLK